MRQNHHSMAFFFTVMLGLGAAQQGIAHSGPPVPDPMNIEGISTAFGWDFEGTEIVTEKVTDSLFVVNGFAEVTEERCTVLAEEVILVDDIDTDKYEKQIEALKDEASR